MSNMPADKNGADSNAKKPYKVQFELKTRKRKELNSGPSYSAVAPPGYTFVPVGLPQITDYCKEKSRLHGLFVYVVSGRRNNRTGPDKISFHIHRIGHHFENKLVEDACQFYGYTSSSRSYVRRDVNAGPSTHALAKRLDDHGRRPGMEALSSNDRQMQQVRNTIKDLFPKIPEDDLEAIVKRAFEEGTERVGTSNLPLPRKVQLAVVAHIRHNHTEYDRILRETSWQEARSIVEAVCLQQIVKWRGEDEASEGALEDFMEEVIVLDDDDVDQNDSHGEERHRESSLEIVSSRTLITDLTPEDDQLPAYSQGQNDIPSAGTLEIIHVQPRRILANSQLLDADEMRRRYDNARTEVQQANQPQPMIDATQSQLISGIVVRDAPLANPYGPVHSALPNRTFDRRDPLPTSEQRSASGTSYQDPIVISSPLQARNGFQNSSAHTSAHTSLTQPAPVPRQRLHSLPPAYRSDPYPVSMAGSNSIHNPPAIRSGLGISNTYVPTSEETSGYGYPRYFSPNMDIDHWPGRPQNVDWNRPHSVVATPNAGHASHQQTQIQRPLKRSHPYEYEETYGRPLKARPVSWDPVHGPEADPIQGTAEPQRISRLRVREQRPKSPYDRLNVPTQRRPASPPPYSGQPSQDGSNTLYASTLGYGPEAIYVRRDQEIRKQHPLEQSQLLPAARPVYVGNYDGPYRSTPPQHFPAQQRGPFVGPTGGRYIENPVTAVEPPARFYDITDQQKMQWEPQRSSNRHIEYRPPYI